MPSIIPLLPSVRCNARNAFVRRGQRGSAQARALPLGVPGCALPGCSDFFEATRCLNGARALVIMPTPFGLEVLLVGCLKLIQRCALRGAAPSPPLKLGCSPPWRIRRSLEFGVRLGR